MARILIAEDDRRLAAFLAKGLRSAGFTPTVCHDGVRATGRQGLPATPTSTSCCSTSAFPAGMACPSFAR